MGRFVWIAVALCVLFAGCGVSESPGTVPSAVPVKAEPMQEYGYAGGLLSGAEAACYKTICDAARDWRVEEEIPLNTPVDAQTLRRVWDAVTDDHAGFYWAACEIPPEGRVETVRLTVTPTLTLTEAKKRQAEIDTAVEILLQGSTGTAGARAAQLHDALLRRITYDAGAGQDAGNLYGGLVLEHGNCGAYSRSYQYLLEKSGVPCAYLAGTSVRGIPHAWNAVQLEDGWYYVDTTWDDLPDEKGWLYHDYLLMTAQEMALDHFADQKRYPVLPSGTSDRLNYYRVNGFSAEGNASDPVGAMAEAFARQLCGKKLSAGQKRPVFLEIKIMGDYEGYLRMRKIFNQQVFAVLTELSQRLKAEQIPVEVETTGVIKYDFNDNTQVLTLYPNASAK